MQDRSMTQQATIDGLALYRTCEYCGRGIEGRADKRFCGNACGVSFDREESKLETFAECLYEALQAKIDAKQRKNLQDLRLAQLDIQRAACSMWEIYQRRSNVNPTVDMAVLVFFKNEVLSELFDLNETSSGYASYGDQLNAYALSDLRNPFITDGDWSD